MSKVLVFGTFDRLNDGHVAFLERARRFGDELTALVVEDEFVIKYKGKKPVWSLKMRMGAVRRLPFKPTVYQEDIRESWKSLKTIQPDVIVLSAEQAGWRHRLDLVLEEYRLLTRVEVLPEKQTESENFDTGFERVKRSCADVASQMQCPHHFTNAKVEMTGESFDDFSMEAITCCEEFRRRVEEALDKLVPHPAAALRRPRR
jgi:cytidyltransferase-like protein